MPETAKDITIVGEKTKNIIKLIRTMPINSLYSYCRLADEYVIREIACYYGIPEDSDPRTIAETINAAYKKEVRDKMIEDYLHPDIAYPDVA
jgi:hypothetical protein